MNNSDSKRYRGNLPCVIHTEILVIDDGSTDNTALLLELLDMNLSIYYLRHITNRGA